MELRKKDPEKYKTYLKATWTQPNMIFARKKANAKKEGISFEVNKEEFIGWYTNQPLECHYCKLSPLNFQKTGQAFLKHKVNLGLDRVDNTQGYKLDNLVLCCNLCNSIKGGFFNYDEMKIIAKDFIIPKWKEKGIG